MMRILGSTTRSETETVGTGQETEMIGTVGHLEGHHEGHEISHGPGEWQLRSCNFSQRNDKWFAPSYARSDV